VAKPDHIDDRHRGHEQLEHEDDDVGVLLTVDLRARRA